MSRQNELAVIGSILVNPDVLYDLYFKLNPEMFVDIECKEIYNEILALYDNNIPVNPIELSSRLEKETRTKEEIVSFLKDAIGEVTTSAEAYSHAKVIILENKSNLLRKVIRGLTLLPNKIEDEIADLTTSLALIQNQKEIGFLNLKEIVDKYQDNYFKDNEVEKLYTGFPNIDSVFGGLEGGEMIVIGARPGVGKSSFVTQVITNMAEKGTRVGYFNLEMSHKQIYERIVSRYSEIGLSRIKNAKYFLGSEKDKFEKANKDISFENLIVTSGTRSIGDIKAESRHQNYDIIIIDYLQLVKPDRTFNNRASEVGAISKAIKELAMELNIPVIALSQMNRENDETQEPNISDLRESGDIEQDASIIALMWNSKNGIKGFKIGKNRQGELKTIGLKFNGDLMKFEECDFENPQIEPSNENPFM